MFLWDFIKDKNLRFLVPKSVSLADCRSTGPVDRSSDRAGRLTCTERARSLVGEAGRLGRSTARELCFLEMPPADQAVDRTESSALCIQLGRPGGGPAREPLLSGSGHGQLGGRPGGSTVTFLTVGRSTGRSTGRAKMPFSAAND